MTTNTNTNTMQQSGGHRKFETTTSALERLTNRMPSRRQTDSRENNVGLVFGESVQCVRVRVYALRIVSRDKILRFKNIIIIKTTAFRNVGWVQEDGMWYQC